MSLVFRFHPFLTLWKLVKARFLFMKVPPWDGKIKDFKLEPASFSRMVVVVVVRLGHHDGWMIAILLCPTFPSDDIHSHVSSAISCTSSIFYFSSQLPVFGTQLAGDLGWKDVGKYHSCIHKRRKSWSNKSFESLLLHISMAATLLAIFQRSIPYSMVHILFLFALVGDKDTPYQAQRRVPGGQLVIIDDPLTGRISL